MREIKTKASKHSEAYYPVTFHYVSVQQMYDLEFFIYHMGAYGIVSGLQDLNGPVDGEGIRKRQFLNAVSSSTTTTSTTSTTTTPPVPVPHR